MYAKEFHTYKPDKKLYWLPHLGTVSLEIELQDRTVNAEVPPLEAAVIELFSAKGNEPPTSVCPVKTLLMLLSLDTWTVADLATDLKVPQAAALKALTTWLDLGVLKEEDMNVYKLLEVAEEAPAGSKPVARAGE